MSSDFLIPVRKYIECHGVFCWPHVPVLASAATADVLPFKQLASDTVKLLGIKMQIKLNGYGPATVRVVRDRKRQRDEGYRINITPDEIKISARTDSGAYYAIQTLRELITAKGLKLRCCRIEDWPDFGRRGVYLDCSRGKVPKLQTLKQLVERLARWKINELQLYIENVFTFRRHPLIGKGYSPFTPEEILELQDYCQLHHVKLVGSMASFGHTEKILMLPGRD